MLITVHTFAQLKDHFAPRFEVELEGGADVSALIAALQKQEPDSGLLLQNCRMANEEEFVDKTYTLSDAANIYFYPPSSGG